MKTTNRFTLRNLRGFSMVEILVVVGIMAMLMVMGGPTMKALFGSSKLGQGAAHLANFLQIAHQTAIKENLPVEVRFYRYNNPATPSPEEVYYAYRMFRISPKKNNGTGSELEVEAEGIEPLVKMPGNCFITDRTNMSSLLGSRVITGTEENVRGLEQGKRVNATYRGFLFRADGTCNLPISSKWFLTVLPNEVKLKNNEEAPDNYVCISINPANGEIRQYTP
jgi:uncharacterized protein (TIGR02596 family)